MRKSQIWNVKCHDVSGVLNYICYSLYGFFNQLTCTVFVTVGPSSSGTVPLYQVMMGAGLAPLLRQIKLTVAPLSTGSGSLMISVSSGLTGMRDMAYKHVWNGSIKCKCWLEIIAESWCSQVVFQRLKVSNSLSDFLSCWFCKNLLFNHQKYRN